MLSRLQDKTSVFKGPMDVLKQVIQKEGLLGLYAGMESTFWRYIIWSKFSNFYLMLLQTGILERRIFRLYSSSQGVTSKTRCLCCAFPPPLKLDLNFIISAEPTRATFEQLRVWCHRWFRRYRVEYTVSHSAISTLIGVIKSNF